MTFPGEGLTPAWWFHVGGNLMIRRCRWALVIAGVADLGVAHARDEIGASHKNLHVRMIADNHRIRTHAAPTFLQPYDAGHPGVPPPGREFMARLSYRHGFL